MVDGHADRHYRRLILIGQDPQAMEAVRPRALEIAEYCTRWGMRYEERLGSAMIRGACWPAFPISRRRRLALAAQTASGITF